MNNKFLSYIILLFIIIFVCSSIFTQVPIINAFPNLNFTQPLFVTHANDGTNRIFVVQQNGIIKVFPNDSSVTSSTIFLDISDRIITGGEQGLLGLAFHPDYATNGYFFVNYTAPSPRRTVIGKFSVRPDNPNEADPSSEIRILEIEQPYGNHNGGMIMFGTDGYLYIGMGDGGSGGDPQNFAQNMMSLLGKMLRIDVDTTAGTLLYGIPPDNPFVGNPNYREEIYASGLRNPWRFSQDAMTGYIFAGDVGQNDWEEIDLIVSGNNYGWRCYEGNEQYNLSGCGSISTYTFPVKVYSNASQECSVTGGYIYRGEIKTGLIGNYIYGDYCSGKIWQSRFVGGLLTADSLIYDAPFAISSFGVDELNELYICNHSSNGSIYRFAGIPARMNTIPASPKNGSEGVIFPVELKWRSAASAENYWIQVASDGGFTSLVVQDSTLTDTSFISSGLNPGAKYYWRVRVKKDGEWGSFSHAWTFRGSITGISEQDRLPETFALHQNFPNPFNPTTEIRFDIKEDSYVRLALFDILGREIKTLTEDYYLKGYHGVIVDAQGFPSGVYTYRFEAMSIINPDFIFTQIKKMLLIR